MRMIGISEEVYGELLKRVLTFDDNPDTVIRRLLEETQDLNGYKSNGEGARRSPRRAEGELLPESEYWRPILELLVEARGSARGSDIIDALEPRIEDRLTQGDLDVLSMGEIRWRNRARFARLRMKELGYISDKSPRGIWEITAKGREFLRERESPDEASHSGIGR